MWSCLSDISSEKRLVWVLHMHKHTRGHTHVHTPSLCLHECMSTYGSTEHHRPTCLCNQSASTLFSGIFAADWPFQDRNPISARQWFIMSCKSAVTSLFLITLKWAWSDFAKAEYCHWRSLNSWDHSLNLSEYSTHSKSLQDWHLHLAFTRCRV